MGQNAGYFNKANQRYSFFYIFSFKKIASKIIKHVMLSYLLLFNKRLEFDFFLNSIQISHQHMYSQANSLKIFSICILQQWET